MTAPQSLAYGCPAFDFRPSDSTQDLRCLAKHGNADRELVLDLAMAVHVERHGKEVPADLFRLNAILAVHGYPLTTWTEIFAWFGEPLPAEAIN